MSKLRLTRCALLLCSVLLLPSCAAMFTGTKSTVLVDSEPRGIPFTVGTVQGVTPQSVEISKKMKEITFTPEGTAPQVQKLNRRFQGGMLLLDLLFTPGYGLVGILVDGPTAAWYKHDPTVFFDMGKASAGVAQAEAVASQGTTASP